MLKKPVILQRPHILLRNSTKKDNNFQKTGKYAPGCMLYSCRERGNRSERERKMKHDRAEVQTGYSAEELLILLKELLICYLEELKDARASGEGSFVYGEQTAYTECLEWIALWEGAAEHGLDFTIEERYPL